MQKIQRSFSKARTSLLVAYCSPCPPYQNPLGVSQECKIVYRVDVQDPPDLSSRSPFLFYAFDSTGPYHQVPFSAVLGEKKNGDDSGQGGGMLCSAERMVRRAVPFVGTAEHRARMRGKSLVVGGGIFCHTHATPRPPPKSVLDALFRGRGSGIAVFSEHTGDLQVVNSSGEVVW